MMVFQCLLTITYIVYNYRVASWTTVLVQSIWMIDGIYLRLEDGWMQTSSVSSPSLLTSWMIHHSYTVTSLIIPSTSTNQIGQLAIWEVVISEVNVVTSVECEIYRIAGFRCEVVAGGIGLWYWHSCTSPVIWWPFWGRQTASCQSYCIAASGVSIPMRIWARHGKLSGVVCCSQKQIDSQLW